MADYKVPFEELISQIGETNASIRALVEAVDKGDNSSSRGSRKSGWAAEQEQYEKDMKAEANRYRQSMTNMYRDMFDSIAKAEKEQKRAADEQIKDAEAEIKLAEKEKKAKEKAAEKEQKAKEKEKEKEQKAKSSAESNIKKGAARKFGINTGYLEDMKLSFGNAGVAVAAFTMALKFLSDATKWAAEGNENYAKAINKNSAAIGGQAKANKNAINSADLLSEELDRLASNSLSQLVDAFNTIAADIVGWLADQFAYSGGSYRGQNITSDSRFQAKYDEMVDKTAEKYVDASVQAFYGAYATAGVAEDFAKNAAIGLTYKIFSGAGGKNLTDADALEIAQNAAQFISSGNISDAYTGMYMDEATVTGWALQSDKYKGVALADADDQIKAEMRSEMLLENIDRWIEKDARANVDSNRQNKKAGEIFNDMKNTLLSFDEVIQLNAKIYKDANDKVVKSIDKSVVNRVEGDTSYVDSGTYTEDSYNTIDSNNTTDSHNSTDSHDDNRVDLSDNRTQEAHVHYHYGDDDGTEGKTIAEVIEENNSNGLPAGTSFGGSDGKTLQEILGDEYGAKGSTIKEIMADNSNSGNILSGELQGSLDNAGKVFDPNDKSVLNNIETNLVQNNQTGKYRQSSPFNRIKVGSVSYYGTKNNVSSARSATNKKVSRMGAVGLGAREQVFEARGGIALGEVNNVTVGEAGKEAIIPLENYNGVDYLANALNEAATSSGGSIGGDTVNVTLNGTILEMNDYNVRRLGQKLAAVIENNKRRNGGV